MIQITCCHHFKRITFGYCGAVTQMQHNETGTEKQTDRRPTVSQTGRPDKI